MPDPNAPGVPDEKVKDTQEDFENTSQVNGAETTEAQGIRNLNRKRTYDAYQDLDLNLARKLDSLFAVHLNNTIDTANMVAKNTLGSVDSVAKQAIRHADVAADALWTDELNPVTRAAGNDITGQAGVNSALASTASLDTVYTNLTSQVGLLTTQVTTLAQALAQSNVAISETNAALVAQLAQLIQNAKQPAGA